MMIIIMISIIIRIRVLISILINYIKIHILTINSNTHQNREKKKHKPCKFIFIQVACKKSSITGLGNLSCCLNFPLVVPPRRRCLSSAQITSQHVPAPARSAVRAAARTAADVPVVLIGFSGSLQRNMGTSEVRISHGEKKKENKKGT